MAVVKQGSDSMTQTCRRSWRTALWTAKRSVLSSVSCPHPPASVASVSCCSILRFGSSHAVRLMSHGLACICGPSVFNRVFDEPEIGHVHLSFCCTIWHSVPNCLIDSRLCLLLILCMKSLMVLNHRRCTGCCQAVIVIASRAHAVAVATASASQRP